MKEKVIELYNSGRSLREISVICNFSTGYCRSILKKVGIEVHSSEKRIDKSLYSGIGKLYESGFTYSMIGLMYNLNIVSVRNIVRKLGVSRGRVENCIICGRSIGKSKYNCFDDLECYYAWIEKNSHGVGARILLESYIGQIPCRSVLVFIDGNEKNCRIENLILYCNEKSRREDGNTYFDGRSYRIGLAGIMHLFDLYGDKNRCSVCGISREGIGKKDTWIDDPKYFTAECARSRRNFLCGGK